MATMAYAIDHTTGAFLPTGASGADNLAYLSPLLDNPEVAVCPSTDNVVDARNYVGPNEVWQFAGSHINRYGHGVFVDLTQSALAGQLTAIGGENTGTVTSGDPGAALPSNNGHSYETWAWMGNNASSQTSNDNEIIVYPTGFYDAKLGFNNPFRQRGLGQGDPLTQADFQRWVRWRSFEATGGTNTGLLGGDRPGILKRLTNVAMPSRTLLVLDSDQDSQARGPNGRNLPEWAINNWPEDHNNHGREGVVIGFLDGHSRFEGGESLVETYLYSNTLGSGRRGHCGVNGGAGGVACARPSTSAGAQWGSSRVSHGSDRTTVSSIGCGLKGIRTSDVHRPRVGRKA
ncbi:MAG: hypothetical protein HC927_11050 [Deltaproteobacteria bacterium]|nr:hypothetical protein [Deltaproteobacteria bacterium]